MSFKNKIALLTFTFILSSFVHAANLQVTINGLEGELLSNTRVRLQALQQLSPLENAEAIKRLHAQAPEQIRLAVQPFGYFKPLIHAHLQRTGEQWRANYDVQPGPQMLIASVQLLLTGDGRNEPELQHLKRHFPLKPGQPLISTAYEQAKQELLQAAEQHGYLSAAWQEHRIVIDQKNSQAQIFLTLNTGLRYQFGQVKLPLTPLSYNFLQRYLPFQTGQPYDPQQLLTLQEHLASSPYFKRVDVTPEFTPGQQQIPIAIDLATKRPNLYQLGLGYGTDTGPRGSLGWQRRYVNARGHTFNLNLTGSQLQSNLQANYAIPGKNPVTDQYNITANVANNHYQQGESHTQQTGINFITSQNSWQKTLALNYQRERFRLDNQAYTGSLLLIPSISWQYRQVDKPVNPSHGCRLSLKIQGSEKTLLSDTRFIQLEAQGKYLLPLTSNSRLVTRLEAGYTSVQDLNSLPLSLRFYAGGTQSIRGFKYEELGPGRYKAVGSIEYQHVLTGNWSWSSFVDAGNAWEKLAPEPAAGRTKNLIQQGAGLGLIWHTPVGAMQLSLAKALSKDGQPLQLQFSMEPEL